MGGASEQITFVSEKPTQGGYSIQLYGVSHQLYTHSYMCYGMNEAERQYLALLVGNKVGWEGWAIGRLISFFLDI